jgi:hypothetical protein
VLGLVEREERPEKPALGFREPERLSHPSAELELGFELSELDLGDVGSSDACPAGEFAGRNVGALSKAADRGADRVETRGSDGRSCRHESVGI